MRHTYQAEQWLPHSIETVFDFFANPENLPLLMPGWQKARIVDAAYVPSTPRPDSGKGSPPPSTAPSAGQGTRMTIKFRPLPFLPVNLAWDAEITEFVWNDHFCDIQLRRGPFAYWRHCHKLESSRREDKPGTLLRDHVEYELPLGPLGDLANWLFVERQMVSIFNYRHKRAEELIDPIYRIVGR